MKSIYDCRISVNVSFYIKRQAFKGIQNNAGEVVKIVFCASPYRKGSL